MPLKPRSRILGLGAAQDMARYIVNSPHVRAVFVGNRAPAMRYQFFLGPRILATGASWEAAISELKALRERIKSLAEKEAKDAAARVVAETPAAPAPEAA
jgi:hypothetical protein